jgi:hypothetical protein
MGRFGDRTAGERRQPRRAVRAKSGHDL